MKAYLDSSAVLQHLLGAKGAFKRWEPIESAYSSQLLRAECRRSLIRGRETGNLKEEALLVLLSSLDQFLKRVSLISVNHLIWDRVGSAFLTPVSTLDAIHLATAESLRQQLGYDMAFITHDSGLAKAASAHGFTVLG